MKCRNCPKPATLHITELVKGNAQELHLCEDCAKQYLSSHSEPGESSPEPDKLEVSEGELDRLDQLVCPTCRLTFREFRNQGRLGCAHCYLAFEQELLPLLENIHGETQHCGKFPKRAPHDSQKHYQLIKLRNELRLAIADESYEQAAQLRDQIQDLEKQLQQPVPPPAAEADGGEPTP